ncbi:MAG: hypothetical protein ABSE80_14725 [Halobacteriota archaeon]
MFDSHVELKYRHDNTFRQVVDTLRALLGAYHITSGELREAAVLAATMHEMENVRPLLIKPWDNYPCMFGGEPKSGWQDTVGGYPLYGGEPKVDTTGSTASGAEYSMPKSKYGTGINPHTFSIVKRNHRVCCHCGLSNVYVSHEYHNFSLSTCKKS